MNPKKIGIIGGQGPVSTADIYLKIINNAQVHFNAKKIGEYPEILINSLPTDDLINGLESKDWLVNKITGSIEIFELFNADYIGIACNTLHVIYEELRNLTNIPIINLPNTVANEIARMKFNTVGILGTNTTVRNKLYEDHLNIHSIKYLYPDDTEQNKLINLIYDINAGDTFDFTVLPALSNHLYNLGAEALILACTELPTIINHYKPEDFKIPIIDCNAIYSLKLTQLSYGK